MLLSANDLRDLLRSRNLTPLAQYGQNFLVDTAQVEFLVSSLPPETTKVLEIGPGLGSVTEILLNKGIDVTAIEIDRGLCTYLKDIFSDNPKFKLIPGDAVTAIPKLPSFRHVIGAIPYNVSTPLLTALALHETPPDVIIFTTQKEMAERVCAVPRTKDYNASSILIQSVFEVSILRKVPRSAFYPQPQVDSAAIRLVRRNVPLPEDLKSFYELLRASFQHRRKALPESLTGERLRRAEEISIEEWQKIYQKHGRHL